MAWRACAGQVVEVVCAAEVYGLDVVDLGGYADAAWSAYLAGPPDRKLRKRKKKSLDIAELVAIAAALEVPPIALLYPGLPDADVEVLPGQHVSSIVAVLRFSGELDRDPSTDLGRLAMLSRKRFQHQIDHQAALALLERLADEHPEEFSAGRVLSVADKLDDVKEINRQIREIPGSVVEDA